jgi:outer membrane protein TolC
MLRQKKYKPAEKQINMRIPTLLMMLFLVVTASGQSILDEEQTLTLDTYLEWVKAYHPVARRGALLESRTAAQQLLARGGFDPKLFSDIEQKSFDGKTYFTVGEAGMKIPSWFGTSFKLGYQWSNGVFLNPEAQLPDVGQAIAGIELTALRGLVIDERRAALQKAKLVDELNDAERDRMVNDLLFDASKAYWDWAYAYNSVVILEEVIRAAELRFLNVRESYLFGDKPAVDTLESLIQVQNRQLDLNEAKVDLQNAQLSLSIYLWYENEIPLELTGQVKAPGLSQLPPEPMSMLAPEVGLPQADRHPALRSYRQQLEMLDVDRRLAAEMLKPSLNLSYQFLGNGFDLVNAPDPEVEGLTNLILQNYKWGIQFEFPLFLRKERGKLQLTDLKIVDTNYKFRQKEQEIRVKVRNYQELITTQRGQISLAESISLNYRSLLDAELERFRLGGSSIFLINSREQKWIDARLKLAKLQAELQKLEIGLRWAAGMLN